MKHFWCPSCKEKRRQAGVLLVWKGVIKFTGRDEIYFDPDDMNFVDEKSLENYVCLECGNPMELKAK